MSTNDPAWQKLGNAGGGRARAYLQEFLQQNAASLQGILCGYVARMGLATGESIQLVAQEVFQDAVVETLAHAERFNPDMQPRAWFLAIAANILKRHRKAYARRYRFEVLTGGMNRAGQDESEQDLLDRLLNYRNTPGPEQNVIGRESVKELLGLVSSEDAQLLDLALLQGWPPEMLASMMGITPGAARVRVHRALARLRIASKDAKLTREKGAR